MSSPIRYAIIAGFGLCCAVFSSAANSQTATRKLLPASVSGRITLHGKGVAGIIVGLRKNSLLPRVLDAKGTTDPAGNYRIAGIAPGSYTVSPIAPAYVFLGGDSAPGKKSLLLSEGDDVQGIDFALERGAVIAGKITDAKGQPVAGERLTLISAEPNRSNPQQLNTLNPEGSLTDDRGRYRIYGLAPGTYKIFVGRNESSSYLSGASPRILYKQTYYPGVTDPAEAKVLNLAEGAELTDIDITVSQTLTGFAVNGRVVDSATGRAIPGLKFGLREAVNHNYSGGAWSSASNNEGEFHLENVTPGKYELLIVPMPGAELRSDPLSFEVIDKDVSGLLIKAFNRVSLTGTVVIEGKVDSTAYARLAELRVYGWVQSESAFPDLGHGTVVNADGSFRLEGLTAGFVSLSVISPSGELPINFKIVRIERDGVVQRTSFKINHDDQQITGLKIVLNYGTGSVRGEVKVKNGPLPTGGNLTLALEKQGDPTLGLTTAGTDSRGRFQIEGVSAGDYELRALAILPGQRTLSTAQSITITEGAVTNVVVSLDLKEKSEPAPTQ